MKLAPADAARIAEIAQRDGVSVEAVAERLLSELLEPVVQGRMSVEDLLDSVPGYYEHYQASVAQIESGQTVPASELRAT